MLTRPDPFTGLLVLCTCACSTGGAASPTDAATPPGDATTPTRDGGDGAATPDAGSDGGPSYDALAALPEPRQEHAVVVLDGTLYVLGGFAPAPSASVLAYDAGEDTWRAVADLPVAAHHLNAAAVDGKIWVVGFEVGLSFEAAGQVFSYDPGRDEWATHPPMPDGMEVGSASVGVIGQQIYLAGGARGRTVDDFVRYDTVTGTFSQLPPLPAPREHAAGAVIDGVFYVAAGRNAGFRGFTADTLAYDPVVGEWQARAPIPTPRGGVAGTALGGRLYVFGGEGSQGDPSGVFPQAEVYDPQGDRWRPLPPMPSPRHGFAAGALGGKIYLPGGADRMALGAVDTVSCFRP